VRNGLASFGISYRQANPFNHEPLDGAVSEADRIAQASNGTAFPEEKATKRAFLAALDHYQRIHLAAHGRQNAIGPAFHAVYLSPEGGDDGRLFAQELFGRDLRGLELITLSACETALGRFDLADNLSGFPATLLMLGAESVIGTLWEVEDACAETFFTTLYKELQRHVGRLTAFARAQRTTRDRYPQHRDWGTFFYMGDWD